ncbi:MAG: proline--tRNA ligase [Tepidiformaceae bacterium]
MYLSKLFNKTLREAPAEAELPSHKLLLRAGLVSTLATGLYSFTPLGWRVFQNIEKIIREEMNQIDGQEIHLPALQPTELWEKSGRFSGFGNVLFKLLDRRKRAFVLAPTHEEAVSNLAAQNLQSYRDLPILLYQFQRKFRDEPRSRGGLIRIREFTMKDAYSFDTDWTGLDDSYDRAFQAYTTIFERLEVSTMPVEADSGAIGGKDSQEFIFLSEYGEDSILHCSHCGYAANAEKATYTALDNAGEPEKELVDVATPGKKTILDLSEFLGVGEQNIAKTVFYKADEKIIFAVVQGDHEVNDTKLQNLLNAEKLETLTNEQLQTMGLAVGYVSPIGIEDVYTIVDPAVVQSKNMIAGANKEGFHLTNVNYGRDWKADLETDITLVKAGDQCPNCPEKLMLRTGIELGHIFKLGTAYSDTFNVTYLDNQGSEQLAVMGCYGIGVERVLAAVIEANSDEKGIIWPKEITPYQLHIVVINSEDLEIQEMLKKAREIANDFGLTFLIDDRDESPGSKFKDADLLGIPIRLTISPRSLEKGGVEFKSRAEETMYILDLEDALLNTKKWYS